MIDGTIFGTGALVGGLLGALIVGFWIASRVRASVQAQLLTAGERAQRAESLADELRRQVLQERLDLDRIRQDLSEASQARAVAETRAAEAALDLNENNHVLDVGCGIGATTEYISDLTGAKFTGIDLAAPCVERATRGGRSPGVRGACGSCPCIAPL